MNTNVHPNAPTAEQVRQAIPRVRRPTHKQSIFIQTVSDGYRHSERPRGGVVHTRDFTIWWGMLQLMRK